MFVLLLVHLLVPAVWAGCGGVSGEALAECEAAEREMVEEQAVRDGRLPAAGWLARLFTRTLLTERELADMAKDPAEICRRSPRPGWVDLRRADRSRVWKVRCDAAGGLLDVAKVPPGPVKPA